MENLNAWCELPGRSSTEGMFASLSSLLRKPPATTIYCGVVPVASWFRYVPTGLLNPSLSGDIGRATFEISQSSEEKMEINNYYVKQLFELALAEDIGIGDITSNVIIPKDRIATGKILSKDTGLIAGLEVVESLLNIVDSQLTLTSMLSDGDKVEPGAEIGKIQGAAGMMMQLERIALNFLRRLSGIATLTSKYVQAVAGYPVKIIDTRKTTPGWRTLEKYAVRVGGGYNHRFGLYDAVLIKDNHIALAGSITKAIEMARAQIPHTMTIEIETKTLQQVSEALHAKPDIIMLDNMMIDEMKEAVKLIGGRVLVEASGNVQLETVKQIAATGINLISVGALTHSAPALDISIDVMVE